MMIFPDLVFYAFLKFVSFARTVWDSLVYLINAREKYGATKVLSRFISRRDLDEYECCIDLLLKS